MAPIDIHQLLLNSYGEQTVILVMILQRMLKQKDGPLRRNLGYRC